VGELYVETPQQKPESALLAALEKSIPKYKLHQLIIGADNRYGVVFEADLETSVMAPKQNPYGDDEEVGSAAATYKHEDIYQVWVDGSHSPQPRPDIVGVGFLIWHNGKTIQKKEKPSAAITPILNILPLKKV
jgi:hypothetical protein